jgi:hypothetical protein
MPAHEVPIWVTVAGAFGIGSFVGSVITQYFAHRQQRKNWISDNKKLEWRELIDALREAIRVMAFRFDIEMPFNVVTGAEQRYNEEAKRRGETIIRDRIFIATKVHNSGLFDQWVELVKDCEEADVSFRERPKTLSGFIARAHAFQRELIRVSREDLGID